MESHQTGGIGSVLVLGISTISYIWSLIADNTSMIEPGLRFVLLVASLVLTFMKIWEFARGKKKGVD